MAADERYRIDKAWTRRSFAHAADTYDRAAALQREVGAQLLERLDLVKLQPTRVLDLGSGTGDISHALLRRYRKARVISLDIAFTMAQRSRRRGGWLRRPMAVCADAERLPFADRSFELLISNLMLQWCQDLDSAFAEFRRVLAPGGLLLFTTFGPDTLKELRHSWRQVDNHTHVNAFLDMHDIGDALLRAGLAEPVMDVERMAVTYPDVRGLMRDLKELGAHNVTAGRNHALTGPRKLQRMLEAYEGFRQDGRLPASYEVVHGHAWSVPRGQSQVTRDGEVRIPLDALRRR
ncbi:MAG: malonyl-ACP O-methyltransferase BioC [Xanthomonadaceae bacterium]|nr:malonyl-ACP O-methyltransferase BioC [Xanthomonadaceae bacterium]